MSSVVARLACAGAVMVSVGLGGFVLLKAIERAPETYPVADTATTSIYALRAARGELAVGAYSRFRWNHPGPLLYELLAPLYALSGYREISLKWTALLVNLASLAGLFAVVHRRAPALAMILALTLSPLLWREQRLLFSAWNPLIPILPLTLTIALAAAIAIGEIAWLPVWAALVSFLVQSHITYATVTAVLSAAMATIFVRRVKAGEIELRRASLPRAFGLTIAVVVSLWALPAIQQVRASSGGNLGAIRDFLLESARHPAPWGKSFVIFSNQFLGPLSPGWFMTTGEASAVASTAKVVVTAVIVLVLPGIALWMMRRRRTFEASFAFMCFSATVAGLVGTRGIVGPVGDYLILWIAAVGMLSIAVLPLPLFVRSQLRPPGIRRVSAILLCGYLVFLAALGSTRLQRKHASDAADTTVRALSTDFDMHCRRHRLNRPVLRFSSNAWQEAMGVILQFYKQRREIAVPHESVYLVGTPFQSTGTEDAEFYLMRVDDQLPGDVTRIDWVTTRGNYRIVQVYRDLPP